MVSFTATEINVLSGAFLGLIAALTEDGNGYDKELLEENKIINRILNGESNAFEHLVVKYQKRLYYTVLRIVVSHDDANDVVQEAFVKAYKNIGSFKEGYRFYTWIYRIAINTALNFAQQKKQRGESLDYLKDEHRFDPKQEIDTEDDIEQIGLRESVKDVLKEISPDMRSVFMLRVFDELSYKEIADTLDISLGTVMSRLNRARAILKTKFQKSGILNI